MTAEQVFSELQKSSSTVSRATVYNNLNKLCDVKLIRRVTLEDSPDRYDRISKHDHLVCQKCGKLADICFDDLTQTLSKQLGNDFLYYDLKVFYICPDCRNADSSECSLFCMLQTAAKDIVVGTAAPEVCPTCNHPQNFLRSTAKITKFVYTTSKKH